MRRTLTIATIGGLGLLVFAAGYWWGPFGAGIAFGLIMFFGGIMMLAQNAGNADRDLGLK